MFGIDGVEGEGGGMFGAGGGAAKAFVVGVDFDLLSLNTVSKERSDLTDGDGGSTVLHVASSVSVERDGGRVGSLISFS